MTHGSLFSGIGGFDLAAEWMGWENIFHCEINPFGRKVLNHYWPKSISYEDITRTDFSIHRGTIDVLTGGFPCQPYSLAGLRKGKEDERHLWPEMLRAIREVQPTYVVGENVLGLVNWNDGMVFEEVQADLEAEGYEVQPFILPAASVNAPHQRQRVWFVAHSASDRRNREGAGIEEEDRQEKRRKAGKLEGRSEGLGICGTAPYTNIQRLQGSEVNRGSREGWKGNNEQFTRFIQPNWDQFPTETPVRNGNDGIPHQLDGITFPKWRDETIRAGGNAVVPQVIYNIFKAIQQYSDNERNI